MKISQHDRDIAQAAIRAAMDLILSPNWTAESPADLTTLARCAGINRSSLYTTYTHLRIEFEQRLTLQQTTAKASRTNAKTETLEQQNLKLRNRIGQLTEDSKTLRDQYEKAVCQLAAQHDEIVRLRQQAAQPHRLQVIPGGRS